MVGMWITVVVVVLLSLTVRVSAEVVRSDQGVRRAVVNEVTEWTFTAAKEYKDPFNEVELDAVFTEPKGAKHRVPAFWAGGKQWKVRYSSTVPGKHTFRTESTDKTAAGLHRATASVELRASRVANPLLLHGPLRVPPHPHNFAHPHAAPS